MPRGTPIGINVGERFATNSGIAKVVKVVSPRVAKAKTGSARKRYKIKFVATGYKILTTGESLRKGYVVDPFYRSVQGIGFFGEGSHKRSDGRKSTKLYNLWSGMLSRCYDTTNKYYQHVTVHPRWHCYQNFCDDITSMPNWNRKGYELDKDILQQGSNIYGPDTCCFIPRDLNRAVIHVADFETWKRRRADEISNLLDDYQTEISPEAATGIRRIVKSLRG